MATAVSSNDYILDIKYPADIILYAKQKYFYINNSVNITFSEDRDFSLNYLKSSSSILLMLFFCAT